MPKMDRQLFRSKMKKEFKKFIKENPAYKRMLFSEFVRLVKANLVKVQKDNTTQSVLDAHNHEHDHTHNDEFSDMFTSVVEEDNETPVTE